eukprot:6131623-Amphidinium_carterae.1
MSFRSYALGGNCRQSRQSVHQFVQGSPGSSQPPCWVLAECPHIAASAPEGLEQGVLARNV